MYRKALFLIAVLAISFARVSAQDYSSQIAEIEAYAQKVREDWKIPALSVAVVKDDKVILAKCYGIRDIRDANSKCDENTRYAIASNSKAFTAAALAILIDEKKIGGWDDKVSKYLPDFQMYNPYVTGELTIRDLLSHRSGLATFSGDLLWYDTTYSADEMLRRVRYLKPVRGFRAGYGYQNLMYLAAGRIVERVSGKSWAEFVTEKILKPIGMARTTTSVRDLKEDFAVPHNESGGKGLRALPLGDVDNAVGLVGLNSSVSDLTKWLRLQMNRGKLDGTVVYSEDRGNEMWQQNIFNQIGSFPKANAPTQMLSGYGLGWGLIDYRGRKLISHTGGLDGMITQTAMMPQEKLGLVVLTNSESPAITVVRNKILDVFTGSEKRDWSAEWLKIIADGKTEESKKDKEADAKRATGTKPSLANRGFTGTYTGQMYGDVTISEENGALVMRFGPAPNFVADLEHWHFDTFRIKWRDSVKYNFPRGWVSFVLNRDGEAEELKIDQPNDDFWFYELELKKRK